MALFWRVDFQQNWGFLGAIPRDYLTEFLFRTIKARWPFRMEGNHSSCFIHFNKGETSFEDGSSKPLPSRKLVILVNKKTSSYGPKCGHRLFRTFNRLSFPAGNMLAACPAYWTSCLQGRSLLTQLQLVSTAPVDQSLKVGMPPWCEGTSSLFVWGIWWFQLLTEKRGEIC